MKIDYNKFKIFSLSITFLSAVTLSILLFAEDFQIINLLLLISLGIPLFYFLLFRKEYLLYIYFFLIPISFKITLGSSGSVISFPSELILSVFGFVFFTIAFTSTKIDKRILIHPLTILLFIDTAWLLFDCWFSTSPLISLKRVTMRILFVGVFYFALAHILKNKKLLYKTNLLYILGLIPIIILVWIKHSDFNFDPRDAFLMFNPYYDDHTIYGACIAFLLIPLFFLFKERTAFHLNKPQIICTFLLLIIFIISLFLSFSRASILSIIIAFSFYLFIKYFRVRIWHFFVLIFLIAITTFVFNDKLYSYAKNNTAVSGDGNISNHLVSITNVNTDVSNLERFNRWICAFRMFKNHPLVGTGPGTYQFEYAKYQTKENMTYISTLYGNQGNAHSEYLTYLSESGLPGFISFLILIFYTIHLGLQTYYRSSEKSIKITALMSLLSLFTFFFHGIFNSFIDQDKIAALVFSNMAILAVIDCSRKRDLIEMKLQETNQKV